MNHPELLPAFCFAFAAAFARLRWMLLSKVRCRGCGDAHIHCGCKPTWMKKLL